MVPNQPRVPIVFDRALLRRRRARGAGGENFLLQEVGNRLLDRLADVQRRFPLALDLGGGLARAGIDPNTIAGIGTLLGAGDPAASGGVAIGADEELLPIRDGALDLVVSLLDLHWVNDLPGTLVQVRRALKPDGLLVAAMFGGGTLAELGSALLQAETELEGGASPRIAPMVDIRDAGALLQRAGFALPVVDTDTITVRYSDPLDLMRDLRAMGETNIVVRRRRTPLRRSTLMRALEHYRARFGGADGRVPATFSVLYLTGWAPHPAQQQALKPGSARHRLAAALDGVELGAGQQVPPRG